MSEPQGQDDKAWKLLEQITGAAVIEQRRARRWGIFFKLLTFGYLLALFVLLSPGSQEQVGGALGLAPHTAVVKVEGVIADGAPAGADAVVGSLRKAFENSHAKAVLLVINSPGGSPVQSGYVHDEIRRLRALHPDKPVYAVIRDIGASGAYYMAVAADRIYADKASLVGSIGVVSGGFGFTGAMEKLGIERRSFTSGEHKSFLDPFAPLNPEEVTFWKSVLETTHQQFIKVVREGRGDRLKPDPRLFSGFVWTGEQALALGLVDGLASASQVAREEVKAEEMVDYTRRVNPMDRFIKQLGASVGEGLAGALGLTRAEQLQF